MPESETGGFLHVCFPDADLSGGSFAGTAAESAADGAAEAFGIVCEQKSDRQIPVSSS